MYSRRSNKKTLKETKIDDFILYKIIGIILVRLSIFGIQNKRQATIFCEYKECILQEIMNLEKKYYLPQLLNASITLIDHQELAKNSIKFLINCPKEKSLNKEEQMIMEDTFNFYKKSLDSKLTIYALSQIIGKLNKYQIMTEKEIIGMLKYLKIEWVEKASFWGSLSFDGIFLDYKLYEEFSSSKDMLKARIIGLLYKLGFQYIINLKFNCISRTTPCAQGIINVNGFLMEDLIFGNHNVEYWRYHNDILNLDKWQMEEPILKERHEPSRKLNEMKCCGIAEIDEKF